MLDSHENPTYVNGQAGTIYKQHPPLVNAIGTGRVEHLRVVFIAPGFAADGVSRPPA